MTGTDRSERQDNPLTTPHSLGMINDRHPEVAHMIVTALENHPPSPNLEAAAHAKAAVTGVHGFDPPWRALAKSGGSNPCTPVTAAFA